MSAVAATVDAAAPALSAPFLASGQGDVEGWFPLAGPDVEVRVQVADGPQGSGPASATLKLDTCTPRGACSYSGSVVSSAAASSTFSFKLPRALQAAGAESPLPFTVTALDRAGNPATAAGALLIDAKPPVLSDVRLVSAGVTGEDSHTWFLGGTGAPPIQVAVPIDEQGVGLDPAQVSMSLVAADVNADPGPLALQHPHHGGVFGGGQHDLPAPRGAGTMHPLCGQQAVTSPAYTGHRSPDQYERWTPDGLRTE